MLVLMIRDEQRLTSVIVGEIEVKTLIDEVVGFFASYDVQILYSSL